MSTTLVASAAPGDYKEVPCTSQAFFSANSVTKCFRRRQVTVGQKITGLRDTWTNGTKNELIAYIKMNKYIQRWYLLGALELLG